MGSQFFVKRVNQKVEVIESLNKSTTTMLIL